MQPVPSADAAAQNSRFPPQRDAILHNAIRHTLAYADVFDYPLTAAEIHRYLEGALASLVEVEIALENGRFPTRQGYFYLPNRQDLVPLRQARERAARQLWPQAIGYGRMLARLPFLRMIAVTGSLAMDNVTAQADVDYLIVTEHGRLWLCRAFIITIVRLARRKGVELCPNYILSEQALAFSDHNLYTAHEIAQMVPLFGLDVYAAIRRTNNWMTAFLPNAIGPPHLPVNIPVSSGQKWLELSLRTPVGHWLERWEMRRKIRKLRLQETQTAFAETDFSPNWCKGHFDPYNGRTMQAYNQRILSSRDDTENSED